jgi:hypothetical protein
MNSEIVGLRTAAVVFGLVCLVQLSRLLMGFELVIGGHAVPLWANAIAFLVTACLSVWMWMLSSHHTPLTH